MARTLLALMVPEADPVVASFREEFDPSARRGLGAHITLIYPFLDSQLITHAVRVQLQEAAAECPAAMFRLAQVHTFPSVVWLAPEPVRHITGLVSTLERAFPEAPAGGGAFPDYVPHLTAARNVHDAQKETIANELRARLADHGPVYCWCEQVTLLVSEERRWRALARFDLLS